MSAMGIPEDEMVVMIINPRTKRPIAPHTLRKTLREELNQGMTKANVKVIGNLFKGATTPTENHPHGNPILQMFWAKTRLHWRDRVPLFGDLPKGAMPDPADDEDDKIDFAVARRIAYALSAAANPAPSKPAKKKVPA